MEYERCEISPVAHNEIPVVLIETLVLELLLCKRAKTRGQLCRKQRIALQSPSESR